MSTISIKLTKSEEKYINSVIERGDALSKEEVILKAVNLAAEKYAAQLSKTN